MYYVIMPTDSDLQHHGILGQKWGKKNGPPYPLDGDISTGHRLRDKIKDKLTERKYRKRVASSQKMLKYRARRVSNEHEMYDEAAYNYAKSISKPVVALGKNRRDEIRTQRARMSDDKLKRLGSEMQERQRELERAKKINERAINDYKAYNQKLKDKYGDIKIKDIKEKDIEIGTRKYNMVKTGLVISSLKIASIELANERRKEVEELAKRPHV